MPHSVPKSSGIAMIFSDLKQLKDAKKFLFASKSEQTHMHAYLSIEEFLSQKSGTSWLLIVIDMRTMLGSPSHLREELLRVAEMIPLLRLRQGAEGISGTLDGFNGSGASLLQEFERLCRESEPRKMRRHPRRQLILNIEYREPMQSSWVKANISDASLAGMFVLTTTPMNIGSILEFRVQNDSRVLHATVRWRLSWGQSTAHFCGVGCEIDADDATFFKQYL